MNRWAWAEVSVGAIEHNARVLAGLVAPAQLWAVVKANGYGHGALCAARGALAGGASGLCVALVQEGVELREGGIDAPVLVLSEQPADALRGAVQHGLEVTVYSTAAIDALAAAGAHDHPVHLKIDTGMHRVGVAPGDAVAVADAIAASPAVRLTGAFTHLAVADEPTDPFTQEQLHRFDAVVGLLADAGHHPRVLHAANSAGAIAHPAARYGAVRPGIAVYGLLPGHGVAAQVAALGLRPALSLYARVSHVKRVGAGERISYGLRHTFARGATVATVPVGYADGVARRSFAAGASVLIGGRPRPVVGVVTMDQLMVDCGDDAVAVGDPVVLIGRQGEHELTADHWADLLGTIGYEIVCGISSRVERITVP